MHTAQTRPIPAGPGEARAGIGSGAISLVVGTVVAAARVRLTGGVLVGGGRGVRSRLVTTVVVDGGARRVVSVLAMIARLALVATGVGLALAVAGDGADRGAVIGAFVR